MNFAIIVAAGKSKRMNKKENKVFLPILGKPMICHTIKNFNDCGSIDEIIVVAQRNDIKKINEIKQKYNFDKIKKIVDGGKERQDSVYNGLMSIKAEDGDVVVVHNGSNPLVREKEIVGCISAAKKHGAAVAGVPLKDTIKKIKNDFVDRTIDREGIYQVQTPQAIKYGIFVEGFRNAKKKKLKFTDDVSLVEALGKKVKIVPCSYENIKITTQDDLGIVEGILMSKKIKDFRDTKNSKNFLVRRYNSGFRIGLGQDSHRFADRNKKLILGGYTVPNEVGLEANSDGDIILHALFNAISSAIGEKSLGYYADAMYKKGITDSREYLKVILNKLNQKNMRINNVSISIEAKKPKLDNHTDNIKKSLSKILKLEEEKIGITCTSGDWLTSFGKGEGMQCFVVVTIKE